MSGPIQSFAEGSRGLALAYSLVLVPMLAALIRSRAPWRNLVLAPILAVPVMLAIGVALALISPVLRGAGLASGGLLRLLLGIAAAAATGYGIGRLLASRAAILGPLHRRGAIVSTARALVGRADADSTLDKEATSDTEATIMLAGVAIPREDEAKHFKFIGATGTGKSSGILALLGAALARGDRAVIADPDGGYLRRFYEPARDVILNPFDGEARKWDLFGEITNDYDVEQLARSLIPDSGGQDRIWSEYARTFLIGVMQQLMHAQSRDDGDLYRVLKSATLPELRVLLAATAAGPFVEEGNEKMFASVRSVASSALRVLQYTTRQVATPLSVRQWVRQGAARHAGGRGGVLFFPYKAGEIAALASVISAWMRLAIFEAMDLDEVDQRLWFVVDELDALGEIDGLKDALARLRKFGGRCILGFQSIAQISGTYGRGAAETIVENCGNTLILRCSASERGGTSEFASRLIGQREVVHRTSSKTRRPTEWMASTTTSEHLRIEPAVMASEIERLPDLRGYLKLASTPDWLAVTLPAPAEPVKPRPRQPAKFALRPEPRPSAPSLTNSDPVGSAPGVTPQQQQPQAAMSKPRRRQRPQKEKAGTQGKPAERVSDASQSGRTELAELAAPPQPVEAAQKPPRGAELSE